MSSAHSTPTISAPNPDNPINSQLAALAASLQDAAQAVLGLSSANVPEESKVAAAKPSPNDREGQTRSFYFPPASINMERELLRKYRAQDFQGLLEEVHTLLVGLVKLMQSVHKDVRVRGHVISSLGAQLDHASALVLRMRNVYDKVMPLQK